MRKAVLTSFAAVFVVVSALGVALMVALHRTPEEGPGTSIRFTVAKGEAFSAITRRLESDGLIRHRRAVSLYAWLTRRDTRIQAGTYLFTLGEKAVDMIDKMVDGDVLQVSVTVPEGFTHRRIAGVVATAVGADSAAFAGLLENGDLLDELGIDGPSLEGYLFPDTYTIPWGTEAKEVARLMVNRLEAVFDDSMRARSAEIGLSRHEALTFASIIEAETRVPEELTLVSAVYHNRLRRGMRLEADPTVAYAMGEYKGRLLHKDLEIDSPYNTYLHRGLPPGPICSPGEGALRAALYPDSACRALYFVAEGNGRHIFSRTLEEHLAAIRKVRGGR